MVCEKPTRAYPDGRTGTTAGYQAHFRAKEPACRACLDAMAAKKIPADAKARYHQRAYERNPSINRQRNLKAKFGLTIEDYNRMLVEQDGKCAICGTSDPGGRWGMNFAVDHDHACCSGNKSCGKCIRRLICSPCNVGLGAFGDDPDRLMAAAAYLLSTRDVLMEVFQ